MQEWGMPGERAMIGAAVERLRAGGVVAFPTETVYGLGADALRPEAVARVFDLKGRPATNPLIVHIADETMAKRLTASWPARASWLARAFWPGPLTIVAPRGEIVSSIVTGGGETVAVRCPDHPVALALLRAYDGPLVGPSANRSGSVSPTTAAHVREAFDERDVLTLDGGACRVGIESTVVSVTGALPIILRPGAISAMEIARALGERTVSAAGRDAAADEGAPMPSPGMMASHYAPRTPASLASREEIARALREAREPIAALVIGLGAGVGNSQSARVIVMPASEEAYAARLYAALREADASGASSILIERPVGVGGMWEAIHDRLRRATAPR